MWSAVVLFSVCGFVQGLSGIDPLVSTKVGLIRGMEFGNGFAKFLGVPYAVVDRSNPFGPSKPHPGFKYIFEAYKSTSCPQVRNNVAVGTIDCLTMDIYVPRIAGNPNRSPVMVWIHGGGFVSGSTKDFGSPKFLLRNDVIVVAINYRLGVYGFMCLDTPKVPGNQGLKDQVLALRWINENIEAFGGNPKEITVVGASSGGISVNLHLLSSFESLFQRAIIQSGSALTHVWTKESDNTVPIKVAKELGFNTSDLNKALEYISFLNPHNVIKTTHNLGNNNGFQSNNTLKGPCIEKELEGVDNFITKHPLNIASTKVRTTPVIIGYNNNESAVVFEVMHSFYETFNIGDHLKLAFDFDNDLDNAVEAVSHFYVGEEKTIENIKEGLLNFISDFYFVYPAQRMADLLVENGGSNVFGYVFSYSGGRNLMKVPLNVTSTGATHGDELTYLFDYKIFGGVTTPEDHLMIDRMTTMWTNFAKFGDPIPETTELLPIKWEHITKTTHQYLGINLNISLIARPSRERMAFWDLFYKHYEKYQI